MNTGIARAGAPVMSAALVLLAGCSSVSDMTREHVARSESVVTQAQQTLGSSEAGAVELQRARENLIRAREALDKKDGKYADAYAQQAQLDAELAIAKSQTSSARKAADDLLASIQTLREEANRPRTPQ